VMRLDTIGFLGLNDTRLPAPRKALGA
jgi:hypothetical protein